MSICYQVASNYGIAFLPTGDYWLEEAGLSPFTSDVIFCGVPTWSVSEIA